MEVPRKEFTLKHVFKDVENLIENEEYYSEWEDHHNIQWYIRITKAYNCLAMYLYTNLNESDGKSVQADYSLKAFALNGTVFSRNGSRTFEMKENAISWGWPYFIEWKNVKDYLRKGSLTVEACVKVKKITVFEKEIKDNLRRFDESNKKYSDVALIINEKKFFVSKLFLSGQSSFFASLFFGNFEESKKSKVELHDVDHHDFQNFLEVLYGELAIHEFTIEGILLLADMYDAQTAIRRCEEYLIEKSKRNLKEKLQMSTRFKMDRLKKVCLDQLNTKADILAVTPEDPSDMDPMVMAGLFEKLLHLP